MNETGLVKITEKIGVKLENNPKEILDVSLESQEIAEQLRDYLADYNIVKEGPDGENYVLHIMARS